MTRIPQEHLARSHTQLVDELAADASARFHDRAPPWDPRLAAPAGPPDLGRGLLDSFALALHVLWTYQEAWSEEGYLSTAHLDASVEKLLSHLGYQPAPGTAAVGLQHFTCRAGTHAELPRGFAVKAPGENGGAESTFETLAPARLDARLNELRAYLPNAPRPARRPAPGGTPSMSRGEPRAPAGGLFKRGSSTRGILDRIEAQRHGSEGDRRAMRAKIQARKLASIVAELDRSDPAARPALEALCDKLCTAYREASAGGVDAPPPLSESQELVAKMLGRLDGAQPGAVRALDDALARCAGESSQAHAARLDRMTTFLDAMVGGLIQEARDRVVLLRGRAALDRLDRSLGGEQGRAAPLGWAPPGTNALFLLDDPPVAVGDWLAVAEQVETIDPRGTARTTTTFREAIRILEVRRRAPEGSSQLLTEIEFAPALVRRYRLDRTRFVGNLVMVSEGKTVEAVGQVSANRTVPLPEAPLTHLRDPSALGGRRPEVELEVNGRAWTRRDSLAGATGTEMTFTAENTPGGGARLRTGDGTMGAVLPAAAALRLRFRIGLGPVGNRASRAVRTLASAHPAVERTFNPLPFTGGASSEPADFARSLGPKRIGAMDRAVSLSDVEALAETYDGVSRARVFADPDRPRRLTVVVAGPAGDALPAQDLERLTTHLAARVPPGVNIRVQNRRLAPIRCRVLLRVAQLRDPVEVVARVRAALGVDTPDGVLDVTKIRLGDDLDASDLYRALEGIDGLHSAVVQLLHRADAPEERAARVIAARDELLAWATADGVTFPYEEARDR